MTPPRLYCYFEDTSFSPVAINAIAKVQDYSFADIGGPKQCTINLYGSEADLWQAIDMLRYYVRVKDKHNDDVWWGVVNEASVTVGGITYGVSLDTMANRIQVTYTAHSLDASGNDTSSQAFTDWADDAESIGAYGTRESRATLSDGTDSFASSYRDSLLEMSRWPVPAWQATSSKQQASVTLHCKGVWDTLDWRYFGHDADALSGLDAAHPYVVALGPNTSTYTRVGFQQSGIMGKALVSCTFLLQKVGQPYGMEIGVPTGYLRCEVWANATGGSAPHQPATMITYADVAITSIPDPQVTTAAVAATPAADGQPANPGSVAVLQSHEPLPVTWNFPNTEFTENVTYYFVLSVDAGDFTHGFINVYCADVPVAYAGYRQVRSNNGWELATNAPGTGYIVPNVRIEYASDTTVLVAQRLATHAQFITGSRVDAPSGVYQSSYEDGQSSLRKTIEALLSAGSTTSARMLATVTPDRAVFLYPEPTRTDKPYLVDEMGTLADAFGTPVPKYKCTCGVWAKLKGVIPASAATSRLADASTAFVDEAEYTVASDSLALKTRGQVTVWNIGQL